MAAVRMKDGRYEIITCSSYKHYLLRPEGRPKAEEWAEKYDSVNDAIDAGWFFVRNNHRCPECTMNK